MNPTPDPTPAPPETLQNGARTGQQNARGSTEESQNARVKDLIAQSLFFAALAFSLFVSLRWAKQPLLDQHDFRQTQTALSTYWLAQHSGLAHWLDYETPVFGSPWQIPMELPLFQWLVALVHVLSGIPLDPAGRCLSALLFYCALWPISMLVRDLGFDRRCFHLTAGLLLLSPVYIYWSRAFLIESTALLLSLLYVAWLQRYLRSNRHRFITFATAAGTLAILTKVTTFATFAAAGGCLATAHIIHTKGWKQVGPAIRIYLPVLASVLVCGICLETWLRHSDAIKASSFFGNILTAKALHGWTYGTLAQKASLALWWSTIAQRAVPEAVGSSLALLVCLLAASRMDRRVGWIVAALLLFFLLPFLVFTNLHIVHNYYQYANALFLVTAVALSLWQLSQRSSVLVLALACGLVIIGDVVSFSRTYLPSVKADYSNDTRLEVSRFLRDKTPQNSVILVAGYGWSPVIAYYSQRRTIYIPQWATSEQIRTLLQSPSRFTGGLRISAVVQYLKGDPPVGTDLWRNFAGALSLDSTSAAFGDFQCLLPHSPEAWVKACAALPQSPVQPPPRLH
jgi:hypothetical protein